ncbi:plastocyanin/azurin family copper-binding protein [Halorubrum sp. DTA98]|uniref:plastocyanin/azurin family copper-binding protein n=1 Tax=Halorubrum sp. DTA98 TaxID=3402163 RepID=UPI003AAC0FB9
MRDGQRSTATGSYRRDVMKVLGVGAAAGMFGGVASAEGHEEDETSDDGEYPDDEGDPSMEGTGTVHVVRTLIRESTSPERPADFFFQPTGLHVEPGDVIKFVFETPDHTVTSYHPAFGMQRRVPPGVDPFSSPILGWDPRSLPDDIDMPPAEHGGDEAAENGDGDDADAMSAPTPSTWLYAFETPGVYDLECAPHEGFGMAMRVVVGTKSETAFETSAAEDLPPPRTGPVGFSRVVLTDPNLEPESILDTGRVEWAGLEANQDPENGSDADGDTDSSEGGDENGDE